MEEYVEATVEAFQKCAVELVGKVSSSRSQEYYFCVVVGSFCAIRCVKDPLFLEGKREGAESGGIDAKKPNMQVRASKRVSRRAFRTHELL